VGGPVGVGGRVVFRPTRLGVAADIAYNRVRTDQGPLVGTFTAKVDARLYTKGLLSKLIRPYFFGGVMVQRGQFDQETSIAESVYAFDTGLGGGIKLWRLEINGEVGLALPVKGVEAYRPNVNVFANLGVLVWLL
ncbi:MAG: hypothetical protein AAF570_25235, partial [Bacteroidota bacterium]